MPNPSRYREVHKGDNGFNTTESDISNSKLCLLFTILCFLGLLCMANLIILSVMYYVLEIQQDGLRTVSFFKDHHIRWVLDTDFETVVLPNGVLSGFSDKDIEIVGDNQNVTLSAEFSSLLRMSPEGTFLKTNNFKFVDPYTRKAILDFNTEKEFSIVGEFGGKTLIANAIKTPRVVSNLNKDMIFRANTGDVDLIGNEGIIADAKDLNVTANDDIVFKVEQSINDIILDGGNGGIRLNSAKLINTKSSNSIVKDAERYRLCMCKETGLLFRSKIQDGVTCAIAKENPCLLS